MQYTYYKILRKKKNSEKFVDITKKFIIDGEISKWDDAVNYCDTYLKAYPDHEVIIESHVVTRFKFPEGC